MTFDEWWKTYPILGEYDGFDEIDQRRWKDALRNAFNEGEKNGKISFSIEYYTAAALTGLLANKEHTFKAPLTIAHDAIRYGMLMYEEIKRNCE